MNRESAAGRGISCSHDAPVLTPVPRGADKGVCLERHKRLTSQVIL